ncbi:MAG: hypothetical protein COB19_01585 [Porticoccus sp.]|jgi:hypothetical protein|nr:MAG: hypothetical protein COB19_01585 [Porticoccus sp.]
MKDFIASCWYSVMDSRYNPLKDANLESKHWVMQVLAWMWSMIFSVSFLSIFHFGILWAAHLLLIAGVFLTLAAFKHTQQTQSLVTLDDAKNFGHSTKCVWKLDSEA